MTLLLAILIIGICFVLMAVGLLQGKIWKSHGCGNLTFRGQKIRCAGCTGDESDCPNQKPEAASGESADPFL